jgi:hypothetical protein
MSAYDSMFSHSFMSSILNVLVTRVLSHKVSLSAYPNGDNVLLDV